MANASAATSWRRRTPSRAKAQQADERPHQHGPWPRVGPSCQLSEDSDHPQQERDAQAHEAGDDSRHVTPPCRCTQMSYVSELVSNQMLQDTVVSRSDSRRGQGDHGSTARKHHGQAELTQCTVPTPSRGRPRPDPSDDAHNWRGHAGTPGEVCGELVDPHGQLRVPGVVGRVGLHPSDLPTSTRTTCSCREDCRASRLNFDEPIRSGRRRQSRERGAGPG